VTPALLPGYLVSFDGDGRDGVSSPIVVSEYHQMPGFFHDFGDPHDLGILLLPAGSVPAGTPAVQLPPAGYLDALQAAGTLKFKIADIVGYGAIPDWESAGPTQFALDGVRRAGTSIITGLRHSMLMYNQNRNGIGTGSGLCFGDSGSPQLAQGTLLVLSVTHGGNGQCNANNQNYRVDTPQARAFWGSSSICRNVNSVERAARRGRPLSSDVVRLRRISVRSATLKLLPLPCLSQRIGPLQASNSACVP
jgi:hypothetical protein